MFRASLRYIQLSASLYLRGKAPVIVYSKERTGSVALYESLAATGLPVIATHYLDLKKVDEGKLSGSARWAAKHVLQSSLPVKFITLVRNPLDNLFSTFARREFVDRLRSSPKPLNATLEKGSPELLRRFNEYLARREYRPELEWFETEFQPVLGIDAYSHPFDVDAGFGRISSGRFEVLLLRTELNDAKKAGLVAEFLGLKGLQMSAGPVAREGVPGLAAENSSYREQYNELKSRAAIPRINWQEIAESPLSRHFISPQEIESSRRKITIVDDIGAAN